MATCDSCGARILFGGRREGNWLFCNDDCARQAAALTDAARIPRDVVEQYARQIHRGDCPRCGGPGPVDVHDYHTIWSAIVISRISSHRILGCRPCARRARLGASLSSMILGWWGFPNGFIFTPVQLARNLAGLLRGTNPDLVSPELERVARDLIASGRRRQPEDEAGRLV